MAAKTQLDLHLSAAEVAKSSMALNPFQTEALVLKAFTEGGNDENDYPLWREMFNERLGHFQALTKLPTPAIKAAQANPPKPAPAPAAS